MRTEIKWALIISLLNFLWLVLEYLCGFHTRYISALPYVTIFSIIIPIVFLREALLEKRNRRYKKTITFWLSVQTGATIILICSVISVFSVMIYFKLINPGFTEFMVSYATQKAAENGENVARVRSYATTYFSLTSYMQKAFAGTMFIGLFITFIWAVLISKKSKLGED
ncbi:DUF4199 domain-containing protein [Solitalea sp. MAHUQ-68]|uniref:DUF4199 domain-containing protein n=1 Tax=Solitalea agri TaxID=2953739 RepID=A0A9X2JCP9_9SPHI|nr:DUF4199 domain-containing protein [Solitalea agri]MCO4292764.1 DUF4199 domain-containing protein [Solitalea agri]